MMEQEMLNIPSAKDDLEDGELSDSDSDGYTPLARPELPKSDFTAPSADLARQMEVVVSDEQDDDDLLHPAKSDSDGSSDESDGNARLGALKYTQRMLGKGRGALHQSPGGRKRPIVSAHSSSNGQSSGPTARPPPPPPQTSAAQRPNKYNIWTESLQEDTLMETMRGCDVTPHALRNRDVESYDYKLKARLQGGNAFERLKRRQSNSDDSDGYSGGGKRMRTARHDYNTEGVDQARRVSVKERIGKRNTSTDSNSDDSAQSAPRHIPDLNLEADCSNEKFAIELAEKLSETHTELLQRVVDVLGKEIPLKLFKETQKIEADGGMLVMKGWRRRTPGGVFLFLLKHCEDVEQELKRSIFQEDKKAKQKEWKLTRAINRDMKVEELKKTLNRQASEIELPSMPLMAHLKAETNSTLSNPPPSPVGEENCEGNTDYEAENIHVNVTSPEKPLQHVNDSDKDTDGGGDDVEKPQSRPSVGSGIPQRNVASYGEEDCLDITCDDMDLF
ncbi:phosphorylated adapter RNA export protein isoform X2 [Anopheles coustani]|uniref:phosphorylated adapter RNA export protein isoform X2 n=1 Tax=Anopheles coustani TaxID=139045 RepID=UPI00265A2A1B|nr:phosphorylated adapter RNA export protein isoform X2 [Anopheles coustani]